MVVVFALAADAGDTESASAVEPFVALVKKGAGGRGRAADDSCVSHAFLTEFTFSPLGPWKIQYGPFFAS